MENEALEIFSPISGKVIPVSEVKDPIFSQKFLGEGVGIIPEDNKVYAPCDCTVATLFPTGHAIGLHSDCGPDIIIHIGRDTNKLKGKYFSYSVKAGDAVKKGDLLMEFDREKIASEGYDVTTPVTVSNSKNFLAVVPAEEPASKAGDQILTVLLK